MVLMVVLVLVSGLTEGGFLGFQAIRECLVFLLTLIIQIAVAVMVLNRARNRGMVPYLVQVELVAGNRRIILLRVLLRRLGVGLIKRGRVLHPVGALIRM
jgi:hypothetical protein